MFAKTIIDSDPFLEMPMSARLLYYDLGMRADDDGFINNPRKIARITGASDGDFQMLFAKKFIIPFDSGVVVIKHWRINNYIRSDRYHETTYTDEKSRLSIEQNGSYILDGIPSVNQLVDERDTELGKVGKLGKDSIGKDSAELSGAKAPDPQPVIKLLLNTNDLYPIYPDDVRKWEEAYPAVDIMRELKKMYAWLDANPKKRKTSKGIRRFINSWLSSEQDKPHTQLKQSANKNYDSSDDFFAEAQKYGKHE